MRNLAFTLLLSILTLATQAGEIIVRPGQSLHDALRQAREWRRTGDARCQGGITISLAPGRYYMDTPLLVRPEDSGTPTSPTIFKGNGEAVVCGDSMQTHTQLWPRKGMERLTGFDPQKRTITIPTPPANVRKAKHLEMVVHQRWAIAILRVKDMRVEGSHTVVSFHEPESRLEFEHPWPQPVIGGERGNSSFLLRTTEQRYGTEQLVVVDGASHVSFEGIVFENTCWNRPLRHGHVTLQGGFPLVDAYKLTESPGLPWDRGLENQAWVMRPVSAVLVNNASHVSFSQCMFQHLGATALDFADRVSDCEVTGCGFEHIGGTAIMAGSFAESPREVHRPYQELAVRCQRIRIDGNVIHEAAVEDWGAVAIALGYVKHCTVSANVVVGVNYSGVCVGWGWTPLYTGMEDNHIINNKVSDYARQLYDAGGIYTLSNQPGSTISDNDIAQPTAAPYATNDRAFCIYLDAHSDGFTLTNNRTDGRLITRDEIGLNNPGQDIIYNQ